MNLSQHNSLIPITPRPDAVMVRGSGSWLWDDQGNRYLDFMQGWAVNSLGHAPQVIQDALVEQSSKLITPSPALHNYPQLSLSAFLVEQSGFAQVFFCNSGAEAVDTAIKLARKWGRVNKSGAYEIITAQNSFHGRTLAAMAASGKPEWDQMFPPNMPGFSKVAFGDIDAVKRAIRSSTVAVMIEPIQGEAGVVVPPPGYLKALRELTREYGILLICDEIQTGVGRTGTAFYHIGQSIRADIMTLGKGLGGGIPISAVLVADRVCCTEYGEQGGTYNGNPLMAHVALSVSKTVLSPEFLEQVKEKGAYLKDKLVQLIEGIDGANVRGEGLLIALCLPFNLGREIVTECFNQGLLINSPRPNLLRFMPALNLETDEIDQMIDILKKVLMKVR